MRKSAKSAIRNNVINSNPQRGDKLKITKVPIGNFKIEICDLYGYTFKMRRIYKYELTKYAPICRLGERGRVVVLGENQRGDIKMLLCPDSFESDLNENLEKLKLLGYTKNQRMFELEESYVESVEMDIHFGQCEYDFEGDILYNAFSNKGGMWVNFTYKGKFICRLR